MGPTKEQAEFVLGTDSLGKPALVIKRGDIAIVLDRMETSELWDMLKRYIEAGEKATKR